ncbi:hypothetical protein ACHAWO_000457 [Cyclotella atomus]|uniref:Uncharacterized protein n=1 Tax=Cyclotella atomus TaxID=382360 RepID=A0ABD3QFY9_9STRA
MPEASHPKRTVAETRSSKRKTRSAAAPFFEPSPKQHCKSTKSKSSVTPSPKNETNAPTKSKTEAKQQEPADSPWLAHDSTLNYKGEFVVEHDFITNWSDLEPLPLFQALKKLLDDPMFHYIQEKVAYTDKIGELRKWRQYAHTLSKYPTDAINLVLEEHAADMTMHRDLLKSLRDEINEKRYGGKRFYLRALNCIFFDSFKRCHVPQPPLPSWDITVEIGVERKYLYLKQFRAWDIYKRRVFEILKVVAANPTKEEGSIQVENVIKLKHRGDMVPMKNHCNNEERCIPFEEVPISSVEMMLEHRYKNLEDRPACDCCDCKMFFQYKMRAVENARLDAE